MMFVRWYLRSTILGVVIQAEPLVSSGREASEMNGVYLTVTGISMLALFASVAAYTLRQCMKGQLLHSDLSLLRSIICKQRTCASGSCNQTTAVGKSGLVEVTVGLSPEDFVTIGLYLHMLNVRDVALEMMRREQ